MSSLSICTYLDTNMLIARNSKKDWRCWSTRTSGRTRAATDVRTRGLNPATTHGRIRPRTRTLITLIPRCRTLQRKCLITRYRETHQGTPYPQRLILTQCLKNTHCIRFAKWTRSEEQHPYRKNTKKPFLPLSDNCETSPQNTSTHNTWRRWWW